MTTAVRPECLRWNGRVRDICNGVAVDARRTNKWRQKFGLSPLDAQHVLPRPPKLLGRTLKGGPGTELKRLIDSLDIPTPDGCNCEAVRNEMDALGVAGCRTDRDRLIDTIRENSGKVSWLAKLQAIVPAITSGLAFVVNPLDPVPGLFDEAVRLAKAKHAARPKLRGGKECGGCNKKGSKRSGSVVRHTRAVAPPMLALPYSGPVRRNLMMHVWPVAGFGAWQWNLDQIIKRAHLFNGRRVIGIVTSPDADRPETLQAYLRERGFDAEFIVRENHKKFGEVVTFLDMLAQMESTDPNTLTFYCHAKGVRHRFAPGHEGQTVFRWTEAMYEACLDFMPLVEQHMTTRVFAGNFRRTGFFRTPGNHRWHYSGTFYWMRNLEIFSRRWRRIDQKYYGTEAWPGLLASVEQSVCLFGDHAGTLYDKAYYDRDIAPAFEKWKADNGSYRTTRLRAADAAEIP